MKDLESIERLRSLEARLRTTIGDISMRGASDGPFLFATHGGRAIEASSNDGQWWIELWDENDDPDAPRIKEIVVKSEDEAYRLILDWLV